MEDRRPGLPNNAWNSSDPAELIDFPCSDAFLRHYHALGMTPREPERPEPKPLVIYVQSDAIPEQVRQQALTESHRDIGYLRRTIYEIRGEIDRLEWNLANATRKQVETKSTGSLD